MGVTQKARGLGLHHSGPGKVPKQANKPRNLVNGLERDPRRKRRQPGQLAATSWAKNLHEEVARDFGFLTPTGRLVLTAVYAVMAHESMSEMTFGVTQLASLPGVIASVDTIHRMMRRLLEVRPDLAEVVVVGSKGRHLQTVWKFRQPSTRYQKVVSRTPVKRENPQSDGLRLPVGKTQGLRPCGPLTPALEQKRSSTDNVGRRGNPVPLTQAEQEVRDLMTAAGCWQWKASQLIRRTSSLPKLRDLVLEVLAYLETANASEIRDRGAYLTRAIEDPRSRRWMRRIRRRTERRGQGERARRTPRQATPPTQPWDVLGPAGISSKEFLLAATAEANAILPLLPAWAHSMVEEGVRGVEPESWYWPRAWVTSVSRAAYLAGEPFRFCRAFQTQRPGVSG